MTQPRTASEPIRAHDKRFKCARSLLKFIDSEGRCVVCGRLVRWVGLPHPTGPAALGGGEKA
jgi:hypothetical protein